MEYKRELKVLSKEVGSGERRYLDGKCSYRRVFNKFINDAVLCNKIVEIDEDLFFNKITGFNNDEEVFANILEELKEEFDKELNDGSITIEELQQKAENRTAYEEYNFEFYQYFIIDINDYELEFLKECNQKTLKIMYSEKLDCYILGVDHFGTSWDYINSDFELIEVEE